jgi:hypothetical protein
MMTATANEILSGYTMDYTSQVHFAMRADGKWFTRFQNRSIYGYRWGAWRETVAPESERFLSRTGRKARLPK